MSWLSPEVVTSLSPTPNESTLAWMMLWASFKLFGSTWPVPLVFWAVSVMVVPPCRSSPSFGVQLLVSAIRPNSAATITPSTIKVRPGWPLCVAN